MSDQGEVLSWTDRIEQAFFNLVDKYNINLEDSKGLANKIDGILPDIYKLVFEPPKDYKKINQTISYLKFNDIESVEEVVCCYLRLCNLYNVLPKINIFSAMTGISRNTIDIWNKANKNNTKTLYLNDEYMELESNQNIILYIYDSDMELKYNNNLDIYRKGDIYTKQLTSIRYDIKKKIREAAQNFTRNNLQGSPVGAMASANNDEEVGLLWEPKKVLLKAEAERIALSAGDVANKYGIDMSK